MKSYCLINSAAPAVMTRGYVRLSCRVSDILRAFILSVCLLAAVDALALGDAPPADGSVRPLADGAFEAWDAENKAWLKPEVFWRNYAERRGGSSWWGTRRDYPPYAQVKEFDTLMIELPSGNCLMQFFHSRWRRANDVRRWSPAFNEYGGCPYVFN